MVGCETATLGRAVQGGKKRRKKRITAQLITLVEAHAKECGWLYFPTSHMEKARVISSDCTHPNKCSCSLFLFTFTWSSFAERCKPSSVSRCNSRLIWDMCCLAANGPKPTTIFQWREHTRAVGRDLWPAGGPVRRSPVELTEEYPPAVGWPPPQLHSWIPRLRAPL